MSPRQPSSGLQQVVRTGRIDSELQRTLPSRYTDVRGIAAHLAITERHVRRLVLERRIPHRKVGNLLRFDIAEIDRWMDTLRRGPVPEQGGVDGRAVRRRSGTA